MRVVHAGALLCLAAAAFADEILLSRGRPALASTVESAAYPASAAVDGDKSTRWSSKFHDPQWLRIDLGKTSQISRVRLVWEKAFGREYQIQISDDGRDWEQIYYTDEGDGGVDDIRIDARGRFVRYRGTARGSNFGHSLVELEVYGQANPDPAPPSSTGVPAVPGWFLTWHDEFDGPELDRSKWTPDDRNLHKNQELQHYRPDDVLLEGGILKLRAQKRSFEGQPYTSGLIDSRGKFYQAYGRFESRIKVPKGKGLWPAFWLLPEDASWPPEIDILEFIGHITNIAHLTLHSRGPGGKITQHKEFFGPYFPKDFHVFGLEWEPDEMRFYVDGKVRATLTKHIPSDPMFIIFNLAVGGEWPGPPDADTVFPAFMEVDYVRVWQKELADACVLSVHGDHGRVAADKPGDRFKPGEQVQLLARPDYGWKFSEWQGDASGSENPLRVTMDKNRRIVAHCVPDPQNTERARTSLSLNKTASASSEESSFFTAAHATDGKLATRWSSRAADPQWLMVDLGKSCAIDSVRIVWQDPQGAYFVHGFATEYSIDVSDDGENWKTVATVKTGNGGTEEIGPLNASGRYVRYHGLKRHTVKGHVILELEVFGR